MDLEKCNFRNFRSPVTLTLTLDRVIGHTIMHHSSTSIYIPNFAEIGKAFCARMYIPTDGHFRPHLMLLGRFRVPKFSSRTITGIKQMGNQPTGCIRTMTTIKAEAVALFSQSFQAVPDQQRVVKTDQSGATRGHKSTIAISPQASYCHCDVTLIMMSRTRSPRSHYDIILIMMSFATELATPTITDILPRLMYKDVTDASLSPPSYDSSESSSFRSFSMEQKHGPLPDNSHWMRLTSGGGGVYYTFPGRPASLMRRCANVLTSHNTRTSSIPPSLSSSVALHLWTTVKCVWRLC